MERRKFGREKQSMKDKRRSKKTHKRRKEMIEMAVEKTKGTDK